MNAQKSGRYRFAKSEARSVAARVGPIHLRKFVLGRSIVRFHRPQQRKDAGMQLSGPVHFRKNEVRQLAFAEVARLRLSSGNGAAR
jgi:hypothetical protein